MVVVDSVRWCGGDGCEDRCGTCNDGGVGGSGADGKCWRFGNRTPSWKNREEIV